MHYEYYITYLLKNIFWNYDDVNDYDDNSDSDDGYEDDEENDEYY